MRIDSTATTAIFAANRARGSVRFDVHQVEGVTRRRHLHESGSLRVRFPSPEAQGFRPCSSTPPAGSPGAIVSTSNRGGRGIAAHVTTAAAEKVYRAEDSPARLDIALHAAAGSHLSWLPQETILFDRARLSRRIEIDLASSASLLLCEIVVFGRAAMGERMMQGEFVDRWRLRRDGKLVFAETIRLDGDIGRKLGKSAVAKGGATVATALIVPGDEALVQRMREVSGSFRGEVGISAWNGFAMARFCAQDAAELRADMTAVLGRACGSPMPRLWLS